jgi:inositol polyphosphate 1-phosphatase
MQSHPPRCEKCRGVACLYTARPGPASTPRVTGFSCFRWTGLCFWGVPTGTSLPPAPPPSRTICVSSSENRDVTLKLERTGYKIVEASGAGYKILAVITGLADAYVLTRDSTFKWDTCGPQAILRALGGDVVVCSRVGESVTYGDSRGDSCNRGGVVAYKEPKVLEDIVKCLA